MFKAALHRVLSIEELPFLMKSIAHHHRQQQTLIITNGDKTTLNPFLYIYPITTFGSPTLTT